LWNGLPFADAKQLLLDLDPGQQTHIHQTPDSVLEPIVSRLHGRPRLLETFAALLRESTYTPEQLLAKPDTLDRLTETLHDWLSVYERAILRALAVYGEPAPRDALEYLLLPSIPADILDSILARLSKHGVISTANGLFSVHALDAAVALRESSQDGSDASVQPQELPALALLHERTAAYYEQRELPQEQWKSISDLAPQIARIEHLIAAGLYDAAAEVLGEIDFDYLLLWGHAQRIIALREPLIGKLTQPQLQMQQANLLGVNYCDVGRVRESLLYFQQGLAIAQQQTDRGWQGVFMGNLGVACVTLGETQRAIELYEQAFEIIHKMGDRRDEGIYHENKAICRI
jgi:tetratricopeptide (TPR) repeat protein